MIVYRRTSNSTYSRIHICSQSLVVSLSTNLEQQMVVSIILEACSAFRVIKGRIASVVALRTTPTHSVQILDSRMVDQEVILRKTHNSLVISKKLWHPTQRIVVSSRRIKISAEILARIEGQ